MLHVSYLQHFNLSIEECIDQYKYLCKNFDMECPKDSTPGKYVRKHCPETCGICRKFDHFEISTVHSVKCLPCDLRPSFLLGQKA